MAESSRPTIEAHLKKLNPDMDEATLHFAKMNFEKVSTMPEHLSRHEVAGEYFITGITPEGFLRRYANYGSLTSGAGSRTQQTVKNNLAYKKPKLTWVIPVEVARDHQGDEYILCWRKGEEFRTGDDSQTFDYAALQQDFAKILADYNEVLEPSKASRALVFAKKVIFEIEPKVRKINIGCNNTTWQIEFSDDNKSAIKVKKAFIIDSLNLASPTNSTNSSIKLTVKQASLLAMSTFNQWTTIAAEMDERIVILTPLCGAIFSKDEVVKIAERLGWSLAETVASLNSSCQPEGQFLSSSKLAVAIVAAITVTRRLEKDQRASIIGKIIQQYFNANKEFNMEQFLQLSEFATGGIPFDINPAELIKAYEQSELHKKPVSRLVKISRQTELRTRDSPDETPAL